MTELLYLTDCYLKEFDAQVTEVVGQGVVLDRTAFYVQGGGQPSDYGTIHYENKEYPVSKVVRAEGKVLQMVEGELPPVGARVRGAINWGHRHQLMRTHTALHILCGVIFRDYGASVTGGNMEPLGARMDFELEHMSLNFAQEVEEKINREVEAARAVRLCVLPREEAFKIPDLIRTKINLLPEGIKEVRVVEIEGLDLQADGGTHVANTKEVGYIKVVGHESKGKINKRLRISLTGQG